MKGKRRVLDPQTVTHVQRTPLQHDVRIKGIPIQDIEKMDVYRELFPLYGHDWFRFVEPYLDVEIDDDDR